MDTLQAGKAFFESVNNNLLLLSMYCHWIGNLSRETAFFLNIMRVGAPVFISVHVFNQQDSRC